MQNKKQADGTKCDWDGPGVKEARGPEPGARGRPETLKWKPAREKGVGKALKRSRFVEKQKTVYFAWRVEKGREEEGREDQIIVGLIIRETWIFFS